MSFVRAGEKMRFSDFDESLYVFIAGGQDARYIEDYGDLTDLEAFCEVMFRVLEQSGVEVDLEMVNKARERLGLEPLDEILDDYESAEDFEELMKEVEEEIRNE